MMVRRFILRIAVFNDVYFSGTGVENQAVNGDVGRDKGI
jgi:hypothetical protein